MSVSDQAFQKFQPKKPPLNPFPESEEDNHKSPVIDKSKDPLKELINANTNNSNVSSNPFGDPEEEDLDDPANPFSDKYETASLERKGKKKAAPPPPRSKSQTQALSDTSDKLAVEKKGRYLKSPKKKAPTPPRPQYKATPPSSPPSQKKSKSLSPPPTTNNGETDSSVASTPSSR